MSRVIKVSERLFNFVTHSALIYEESKAVFLDDLIFNRHLNLVRKQLYEKKAKSPISQTLIKEGLKLIKEVDSEKAKMLELELEGIRRMIVQER